MRLIKAFFYSLSGLFEAFKGEAAFRLEIYMLPLVLICVIFLNLTIVERALLIFSYGVVLVTELLNTAIEKTIDRISLEEHPLSKKVKDIASAAVFISILVAGYVWMTIIFSKIV